MAPSRNSFAQDRLGRHPLHPLIVHLPVGLWVGSLIMDVLFFITNKPGFAAAAFYTLAFGILGAIFAIPTGLVEFSFIPTKTRIREIATLHLILNLVTLALYIPNFVLRKSVIGGPASMVPVTSFVLSILGVSLLAVSGYLGGKLVYDYGIGFRPQNRPVDESYRDEAA